MKDTQSEIKQNIQGTNRQEGNQDSKQWFGTKRRNKHPTGTEWRNKNSKKLKRCLGTSRTTLNNPISELLGEGEEQQQDIENLFEQIMKENVPSLVKEIDFQEVQVAQRVPKRNIPKHIIIKLPKIKDKERILKAARGKERVTYKGVPIRLSADFS